MTCDDMLALLPEYWDGKLDEADRLILEAHLDRCTPCREEAARLRPIWSGLGELARDLAPGDQLRTRFYDRLEAYRLGAESAARPKVVPISARRWLPAAVGIAAALALGFFVGSILNTRRDNTQLSQLRTEVGNMRQLVALSLLQQQSASDRLQGVNWTYRVERSDTEVLSALLYTVNHDTNVNVRLAAVDALRTFAESPVARRGLVQAMAKQPSPMVQIALIDQLVELKVPQARPALQTLAASAGVNSEVKERAQWALARLD
jgi:anti-sigma factor RsiW